MPLAPAAGGGSLNPIDFKHKVTTNVENVIGRISGIAPQCFSEEVKVLVILHGKTFCFLYTFSVACFLLVQLNTHRLFVVTSGGECNGPSAISTEGCY